MSKQALNGEQAQSRTLRDEDLRRMIADGSISQQHFLIQLLAKSRP